MLSAIPIGTGRNYGVECSSCISISCLWKIVKRRVFRMKRIIAIVFCLLCVASTSFAGNYNYISAKQVKENLAVGSAMIIVDIQVEKEFNRHHLPGSVATYAYPVKSDVERARIDQAVKLYEQSGSPVVVVCPGGKSGAKRCYDYMESKNVPAEKMMILENGMGGWPYKELVQTKN
ncbi:unknown protein [Desulfotalea psychrophila LSv54]|uniref:Rhodanese domain-containing protein n=2 Tax=Desulfotalea psychrophila TaxID=84980 RepID=Q6AK88_DESPS|nr:unknown protein [Desulfotalea psychrophila LSv54]